MDVQRDPPAAKSDRFPDGIPYIVGNEGAERFSYYGMRNILYVYLTSLFLRFVAESDAGAEVVKGAQAHALEVTHLFMAGVYAFPMIGAIFSDRLLGKYRVIFWVSLIYVAGHATLAVAGRFGAMQQFSAAEWGMYGGLALIALGSGGIKPCVSANVGDQFNASNGHLVQSVFQIFYFIINYGSFFATLLIPFFNQHYGAEVAFAVPGLLMAIAAIVFWLGRDKFVRIPPNPGGTLGLLDSFSSVALFVPLGLFLFAPFSYTLKLILSAVALVVWWVLFDLRQRRQPDDGFLALLIHSIRHQHLRKPGMGFFDVAREKFGDEAAEGPPAVLRIMVVFSMVSVFWALFDQHSTTWVQQAKQMDLTISSVPEVMGYWVLGAVPLLALYGGIWLMLWVSNAKPARAVTFAVLGVVGLGGVVCAVIQAKVGTTRTITLLPSQMQALNPLLVMIIIPLLNLGVWKPLERANIQVKPLQRMTVGMFLAAGAFVVAALLQRQIDGAAPGVKVHALWQVAQYFVMTTSEVLVSTEGLAFAYTQAPRRMKSTIMGFWLLNVTFGNKIVAVSAPLFAGVSLTSFFFLFAGLAGVASLVFAVSAYFYQGKTYLQQAK